MQHFLELHADRVSGSCLDLTAVLFRGTNRTLSYVEGMDMFLSCRGVLYENFSTFVQKLSNRIKDHAENMAKRLMPALPLPRVDVGLEAELGPRNHGNGIGLLRVLSASYLVSNPAELTLSKRTVRKDKKKKMRGNAFVAELWLYRCAFP